MVLTILCLGKILYARKPIFSFISTAIGIFGSLFLAGFFGAWLSFSAVSRVEPKNYIGAKAALKQLTGTEGVLNIITQLSLLSFIGIISLCIWILSIKLFPKWSPISIISGCLIIIVFMGLGNWMLIGSILIFIGLVPVGKFYKSNPI
ncbi:type IV secretory pathway TrbD component [Pedobacter sp. UYEF25]